MGLISSCFSGVESLLDCTTLIKAHSSNRSKLYWIFLVLTQDALDTEMASPAIAMFNLDSEVRANTINALEAVEGRNIWGRE